ncbi:hypothetical protein ACLB2K_007719 [Fragaria x ananassa]
MTEVNNKQVILRNYITAFLKDTDLYVSSSFVITKFKLPTDTATATSNSKPIFGYGVAEGLDSQHPDFKAGDLVWGTTNWEQFSLLTTPKNLIKIQHTETDVPLSYYAGILGITGLTSIFATALIFLINRVDLLKNKLGFDEAFNYKEENDLDLTLKRYFPEGIDIYFDNVGSKMLDAVLLNMRVHGRIAGCGMISQYNLAQPEGVTNLMHLLVKRVSYHGFTVRDYYHVYPKFLDFNLPYDKERSFT